SSSPRCSRSTPRPWCISTSTASPGASAARRPRAHCPPPPWPTRRIVNISEPFIRRPIGTSLLAVGLLLAAVIAYRHLPVPPLPQVESAVIQAQAGLPGARPDTTPSAVAAPVERPFGRMAGGAERPSTSLLGGSTVVLQFDLNRNIDAAARDVQAAINAARSQLPP